MDRVIIAGTSSGVGKTTISLGIMAALTKRGVRIAPFKVGPDYIDPGFHSFVTNVPSKNLDSWMLTSETVKFLFLNGIKNKDMGIIEGVMGLYDGFGSIKDQGSTAHISKILKTPVILVIDASAMSTSAAAIVLGFKHYDRDVDIKGIIVNKVAGKAHYEMIKEVIERDVKIPCIGFLPSSLNITLKSRHLGLIPPEEIPSLREKVNQLAVEIEKYIDLDLLLDISKAGGKLDDSIKIVSDQLQTYGDNLTIGVAKDKAFSFYYEDNLELLRKLGVNLVYFSPLRDKNVPKGLDGIYLGGGFPEVFAKELKENKEFRDSLKNELEAGMPTYAECGGLIYLSKGIEDLSGNFNDMVDFFPIKTKMNKTLQRFGYTEVTTKTGVSIKGHEFHRSSIESHSIPSYFYHCKKTNNKGEQVKMWECGLVKKKTLAGYPHIHFYSNLDFLKMLLETCQKKKKGVV
ncbi:cobyrinate a,c-diamide synthase [Alkalicella caledoniensis]|uniref:Cobyrinate a,c-diamide synthase n=1 Tax=Alkalicella caledoniensis TaxID=2731377 RepID=A0A7G9W5B1_ALKCA|nr:cobyrinate a,c-diamide synthase [Alkalicella caledoniensis]QNO13873.1 cobyrinate a,c-diamide synthase [Alkalicella caledoniensis]